MLTGKNIIVGPAHPSVGGIADLTESLCRACNKEGVQSKIISYSLQYPHRIFSSGHQNVGKHKPTDITIEPLINSVNPITWFKTANRIKKEKPDYIILRYWVPLQAPCLGIIARLVKKNTNIKVIAIADDIIPHSKGIGDYTLIKYFLRSCDAFVVMSEYVMNELKAFLPDANVIVLSHPVYDHFGDKITREESLNRLNLPSEIRYILFFGFIKKYKGLDLLIEAMANSRVKDLKIKLIIAGQGYSDIDFYKELIKKKDLHNNIILRPGFVPQDDVRNYFCAADMVVQPYRNVSQSGISKIAYHFGKPMLVTNVGGLSEAVGHLKEGYVVNPDSVAISDAIVDFYENSREAEFNPNVIAGKELFSWKIFVNGVADLYKKITTK